MSEMRMPVGAGGERSVRGVQVLPVAPEVSEPVGSGEIANAVESWLHAQPGTSAPVLWCPRGSVENTVRGVDELAVKVATLAADGAWAVVQRRHGSTWAQCLRVPGGWIVEANGVPGPECFARRVHSIRGGMRRGRRYARDGRRLMAIYEPRDVVATPAGVAEIIWTWLRGSMAEGFALREIAQ